MIRIIIYALLAQIDSSMGLAFFGTTESDVWEITTSSQVASWIDRCVALLCSGLLALTLI